MSKLYFSLCYDLKSLLYTILIMSVVKRKKTRVTCEYTIKCLELIFLKEAYQADDTLALMHGKPQYSLAPCHVHSVHLQGEV